MTTPTPDDSGGDTSIFRRPLDDARLRMSRLSTTSMELSEVFRKLCEIAANALLVERVGIWLLVDHGSAIRCVCLVERSGGMFSEGATLRVADFPGYFASLKVRKSIPAESARHDPRTSELSDSYLEPLGITSMLDAPILIDGQIQGVVCHEHVGAPREWSTEERDFAGSVADLIALKIKGAEMENLRRVVRDLDADRAEQRKSDCVAGLAAGVAHDFRNLLGIISGYAKEIALDVPADSSIREHVDEILKTVDRGTALTSELMAVGREQGGHPKVFDPGAHLAAFLPALRRAVGERHTVEFTRAPGVGRVFIEPSQLERIALNLVLNARDAMTRGGAVAVSVSADNGHVTLAVSDTGGGVEPGDLERIFDPFFTTKARGHGTGLGLTVVQQAVERAGGDLQVENRPGEGATFCVVLPRVSGG